MAKDIEDAAAGKCQAEQRPETMKHAGTSSPREHAPPPWTADNRRRQGANVMSDNTERDGNLWHSQRPYSALPRLVRIR